MESKAKTEPPVLDFGQQNMRDLGGIL